MKKFILPHNSQFYGTDAKRIANAQSKRIYNSTQIFLPNNQLYWKWTFTSVSILVDICSRRVHLVSSSSLNSTVPSPNRKKNEKLSTFSLYLSPFQTFHNFSTFLFSQKIIKEKLSDKTFHMAKVMSAKISSIRNATRKRVILN